MRTAIALALAVGTAGHAAAADSQFNLVCSGTQQTIVPSLLKNETKPYTDVYRVDLDAKRWCSDDCKGQFDLASVTPTGLLLQDKSVDTPREHEKIRNYISRETGEHSVTVSSGIGATKLAMFWKGQCEKAPFSGFPKFETKF